VSQQTADCHTVVGAILALCGLVLVLARAGPVQASATPGPGQPELYVATDGNDTWSGTLPAPNPEHTDGPLATLGWARDLLRGFRQQTGLPQGATVYVRGGEYALQQTLELEDRDSGANDRARVLWTAYRGERPVLIGAREITGLRRQEGGVLATKLTDPALTERPARSYPWRPQSGPISQLFYDGERMRPARFPNFDPTSPYGGGYLYIQEAIRQVPGEPSTLIGLPGSVRRWAHPEQGQLFVFPAGDYWNAVFSLQSADPQTGRVTVASENGQFSKGNRYFFQNLREELDAPNEYFYNQETKRLLLIPPAGKPGRVMAPVIEDLILLKGARSIEVRGFTLRFCDGAAVQLTDCERCVVSKCTIDNVMLGIAVDGGSGNRVVGNDVAQIGTTGITLSGGDASTLTPAGNEAVNNYVHHVGVYYKCVPCISVAGVGNRVAHNLLHDAPRWGILAGGNDHLIEYNHVRHTNLETCDTGAIYMCTRDWLERGTVIRYNIIADTLGYGPSGDMWVSPHYSWGIYLDDWTSGVTCFGNISVRAGLGPAYIHSGRDNVFENNILADGAVGQMWYSSWPTSHAMLPELFAKVQNAPPAYRKYAGLTTIRDARADATMSYNKFVHNIVSYGGEGADLLRINVLDYSTTQSDYNVIWHFGKPLTISSPITGERLFPPSPQADGWRGLGFEQHSVFADPLFADPKRDDFRLSAASPAFQVGFQPIPVDRIGPYASRLRASWPIVEAEGVREHPLICSRVPVALPAAEVGVPPDESRGGH
jgi:hypothetical protein